MSTRASASTTLASTSTLVSGSASTDEQATINKGSVSRQEARLASDLVDEEEENLSWAKAMLARRTKPLPDPDAIATRRSVFDDPHVAAYYWPQKDYENIHRFDPLARWTYREEDTLLRKVDWKVMLIGAMGFFALNLDRGNISQANSANFLSDLGLTRDDFNHGNIIYFVVALCAELPSQLFSKRIGPDRWIPIQICLWSIVTLCQFWLTGKVPFFICRALLALLQAGFIPNMVLYLSYFYTKTELPIRLAGLWMTRSLCGIVASFLAYGILHIDGVIGKAGWRWLFLTEGLITFAMGATSFFNMPPSPTQTKAWFRPKGWFTEREEVIIVNKVLRDDPTKSDMHNREGLTLGSFWTAICDYDLWPMYILGLVAGIPDSPPTTYLTLLLRDAGFSTFQTNLLTIPSQAFGMISTLLVSLVSEAVGERTMAAMMEDLWTFPFLVLLYVLPSSPNPWILFGVLTALLSYPHTQPIQVGWCSRNSGGVARRTVNASLYDMFQRISRLIPAQMYVASDAPRYERGNRLLIIICAVNLLVLYPGAKTYYVWRNRQRAKIWDAMTPGEKMLYLRTTRDVGNKRLDFRFAH